MAAVKTFHYAVLAFADFAKLGRELGVVLYKICLIVTRLLGDLTGRTTLVLVENKHFAASTRLILALDLATNRHAFETRTILTVYAPASSIRNHVAFEQARSMHG